MQQLDGRQGLVKDACAADPVVLLPVRVIEADADLERIEGPAGQRREPVGHGVVDERAVGEDGRRRDRERIG